MPPIFSSEIIMTVIKEFTPIFDRGYIMYKDGIILPQSFLHNQQTFSTFA